MVKLGTEPAEARNDACVRRHWPNTSEIDVQHGSIITQPYHSAFTNWGTLESWVSDKLRAQYLVTLQAAQSFRNSGETADNLETVWLEEDLHE